MLEEKSSFTQPVQGGTVAPLFHLAVEVVTELTYVFKINNGIFSWKYCGIAL